MQPPTEWASAGLSKILRNIREKHCFSIWPLYGLPMHRCFWKQQRIRSMRLLRLSGIRIRCISAGFFISRKDVRHRNVGRGIVKKGLTSCQALFNSISSYLTFYINDTPSLKINIMLKLFQTSSTGTIWKYTGSPRWSSCFLRCQITFFFSSRIRLKPFILKYTLHFSFSQNLRNHKRTPYSPSADRWQDVSHQSSHIFPVLSNILSVHTAHLTSHSFHLIIS